MPALYCGIEVFESWFMPVVCRVVLEQEHSGRVFRLQFDEFQIVSSSHDDTILIWDFLRGPAMDGDAPRSPRTYTYIAK